MYVDIEIKWPLVTEPMLEQERIPCLCKIGTVFNLDFIDPLPPISGEVFEYDLDAITDRVWVRVGGSHIIYEPGAVTLRKIENGRYGIDYLAIFNTYGGWTAVVQNGEYAPVPPDMLDEEEPSWIPSSIGVTRAERRAKGRLKRLAEEARNMERATSQQDSLS